jgi:hypothetical protein
MRALVLLLVSCAGSVTSTDAGTDANPCAACYYACDASSAEAAWHCYYYECGERLGCPR